MKDKSQVPTKKEEAEESKVGQGKESGSAQNQEPIDPFWEKMFSEVELRVVETDGSIH